MKNLIAALALAALPLSAAAQAPPDVVSIPLAINYELDSTTRIYPSSQGVPRATFGATSRVEGVLSSIPSNVPVTQTTTTLAATVASSAPFSAVNVGDFIRLRTAGVTAPDTIDTLEKNDTPWMRVTAKASANSITVSQSATATAVGWEWRRFSASTQVGYGWVPVRGFRRAKFTLTSAALTTDTAGINYRVECRQPRPGVDTGNIIVAFPNASAYNGTSFDTVCQSGATFNAAGFDCNITDANMAGWGGVQAAVDVTGYEECRIGLNIAVADDGSDAVPESLTIFFTGSN